MFPDRFPVAPLAMREFRHWFYDRPTRIESLATPCILLVGLHLCFGPIVSQATGESYIDRLLPLMILQATATGSTSTALRLLGDREVGLQDRLTLAVGSASVSLLGRLLGDCGRVLAQSSLLIAVGTVLGFRFPVSWSIVGASILLFATCAIALSAVSLIQAQHVANAEQLHARLFLFHTVSMTLSSGLVPESSFPAVLRPIVRWNLLSSGPEVIRKFAEGGQLDSAAALRASVVSCALLLGLATWARKAGSRAPVHVVGVPAN